MTVGTDEKVAFKNPTKWSIVFILGNSPEQQENFPVSLSGLLFHVSQREVTEQIYIGASLVRLRPTSQSMVLLLGLSESNPPGLYLQATLFWHFLAPPCLCNNLHFLKILYCLQLLQSFSVLLDVKHVHFRVSCSASWAFIRLSSLSL